MTEQPNSLHRAIEAAKMLRLNIAAMLKLEDGEMSSDDLQTLRDTFDGETTLDVEIRTAVLAEEEDKILVTGIKAREAELFERRRRLEKRIEARRGLIEQAMAIAGWPKHVMDIGTVSLGKATPRVEIDQESEIPTQFWKRQDPVLDKAGLGKTLKERHKALEAAKAIRDDAKRAEAIAKVESDFPPIPGAHLETEGCSLTITRK